MNDAPEREWVSAGHYSARIPGNLDRVPLYAGEHLWTWAVVFRAFPGAEAPMLDRDNLLSVAGIACHYCRTEYTRRIAGRLCTGRNHRL